MKIKNYNQSESYFSFFDILDSSKKEYNLSKSFAYLLSKDSYALKTFLEFIGVNCKEKNANKILKNALIEIEHKYGDSRTDIEIEIKPLNLFIIIECKIRKNNARKEQFEKYEKILNSRELKNKIFVFISEQRGINLTSTNTHIIDITWREVVDRIWKIQTNENTLRKEFISYFERNYGMNAQGEILVQDLKDKKEIERFENNCYRRGKVNGRPMYFSPYFTRSNQGNYEEGISTISRILGVITIQNITWNKIEDKCKSFIETFYPNDSDRKNKLLEKWKEAITINKDSTKTYTYFFLDNPVRINNPILKSNDSTRWINRMIPPNRCVSFDEFIYRMQLSGKNGR